MFRGTIRPCLVIPESPSVYRGARVAVVIPAHNEERLIALTLGGMPGFVDDIVVVDDASTDGTVAAVRALADARIRLHSRRRNGGVGAAILDGYCLARAAGAVVIVVVGGDAQMDPAEMPQLIDAIIDRGADYAKGARLGHPEILRRMPPVRLAGNLALSWLTRLALGRDDVRDSQCGYAAVRADLVPALPFARLYKRYGFPNDLLSVLIERGARFQEVPVRPIYGCEESGIRIARTIGPLLALLARIAWRHRIGKGPRVARGEAPCAS
jgi:glycosyltransferase involved in cell wall biosynthesis